MAMAMARREQRQWTRAEVAARASKEDAALIIDNVVYDVTEWLDHHPGGPEVLLDNAGGDASQCFHDVGHSEDALQWRERFKVGEVVAEERRPAVKRRAVTAATGTAAPPSAMALLRAVAPPAALAALALLLYHYIF